MNFQTVDISSIKTNPNNPRTIKDASFKKLVQSIKDFPKMLEIRPIVVNADMIVLGGNMRLKACKDAGLKQVPIIYADDLTEDQQREFIIKDNVGFGEWDFDVLANEWDPEELTNWGLDVPSFEDEEPQAEDDNYSRKIESPIYEPKNEKPKHSELVDQSRYETLIEAIEKADIEEVDKAFLRLAAQRHLVFNYSKIADFYAHSEKDVQKLMEDSALVIIDFDRAIELGFVKISNDIAELYKQDYKDEA